MHFIELFFEPNLVPWCVEIFLGDFLTNVFTRNQCPKSALYSIRNAASGALPLVVDLGCGYIYVTG